jgi:hypothetical protein
MNCAGVSVDATRLRANRMENLGFAMFPKKLHIPAWRWETSPQGNLPLDRQKAGFIAGTGAPANQFSNRRTALSFMRALVICSGHQGAGQFPGKKLDETSRKYR